MPRVSMSQITYRKLRLADHKAFETHLLSLDTDCRRTRFGMTASDAFLRQYADRCFVLDAILHGAFLGEVLIGVGELRPSAKLSSARRRRHFLSIRIGATVA